MQSVTSEDKARKLIHFLDVDRDGEIEVSDLLKVRAQPVALLHRFAGGQ